MSPLPGKPNGPARQDRGPGWGDDGALLDGYLLSGLDFPPQMTFGDPGGRAAPGLNSPERGCISNPYPKHKTVSGQKGPKDSHQFVLTGDFPSGFVLFNKGDRVIDEVPSASRVCVRNLSMPGGRTMVSGPSCGTCARIIRVDTIDQELRKNQYPLAACCERSDRVF